MTVYSFYSYKGGVGRSMTLANLAVMFYRRPLNVIVVDWDLEAPGIERYFAAQYPTASPEQVIAKRGLCDLIAEYRMRVARPPEFDEPPPSPYPSVDDHLITIAEKGDCRLRLMSAGARSDWSKYAGFVQSFDWADFYANWHGGGFFDWLRDQLVQRADVVLIDTRTGITEMGGVATRHMADVVVVIFAGNEENMESSTRMAETFLATNDGDRGVKVILVPSRIDDSDSGEYSDFLTRLTAIEEKLAAAAPPDGWQMLDLLLPYRARLAFREQLVMGDKELQAVLGPIVEGYRRIAAQMQRLAPAKSRLRLGAGVARGRVYLLEHQHQRSEGGLVRQFLEEDGFEVVPPRSLSTSSDPDEAALAGAGCVVALLDEMSSSSRSLSYVLSHSVRLGKRVVPVLLDELGTVPILIADVKPLQWDPDSMPATRDALLRAIRGIVAPSTTPSPGSADVFLSYGRGDEDIAKKVAHALQARGIATWLDADIEAGVNFTQARQEALDSSRVVVVFASKSLEASRFAQQEVAYARSAEKLIVPVRLGSEPLDLSLSSWPAIDATTQPMDSVIDQIAVTVQAHIAPTAT